MFSHRDRGPADRWARPGMMVTFRAELMPGRSRSERTFRISGLLPSGRVTLDAVMGEHAETEFEPLRSPAGRSEYVGGKDRRAQGDWP